MVYNLTQTLESSFNTFGAPDNPWAQFKIKDPGTVTQSSATINIAGHANYQHDAFQWQNAGNSFVVSDLMGQNWLGHWNQEAPSNSPTIYMAPQSNMRIELTIWIENLSNDNSMMIRLNGANNDWLRIDPDGLEGNTRTITGSFEVLQAGRTLRYNIHPDYGSWTPTTDTKTWVQLSRWQEVSQGGGGGGVDTSCDDGWSWDETLGVCVKDKWERPPTTDLIMGDDLIDDWLKLNEIEDQPFALIGLVMVVAFGYLILNIWRRQRG